MAKFLALEVWEWTKVPFKFAFPGNQNGPADFRRRIGTIAAAEGLHDILALWLVFRVRDCLLYEDTERCPKSPPTLPLAIHIAGSSNGEAFLGMGYDESQSVLHLMGLWHVNDACEQDFIDAAMTELR